MNENNEVVLLADKKELKNELKLLENVFTRMDNLDFTSKEEVKLSIKDSMNFFLNTIYLKKEPVVKEKFIELLENLKDVFKEDLEDSQEDLDEKDFYNKDFNLDYYINELRNLQ